MTNPFQPPKGTRDFLPEEMTLRREVIEKLRAAFINYGYGELETPAFEYLDTLIRKSGPEVEKEIYAFEDKAGRKLGLIFEFTTSLARVVATRPSLVMPFKRYAIGKVWRYENPQSGRYREFYQADVDIVGSSSVECEVELLSLASTTLESIQLDNYLIHLNSRKILEAQAEVAGIPPDKIPEALRALDKLSKIGPDAVQDEFVQRGMSTAHYRSFMRMMVSEGHNRERLERTGTLLASSPKGIAGVEELTRIVDQMDALGLSERIMIDPYLVRGLDYYTGPIFEAKSNDIAIGSFAGGGRYDRLIELFGGRPLPAVGISFGVERIADMLAAEGAEYRSATRVFIASVSPDVRLKAMRLAEELRRAQIPTQTDLSDAKLGKQLRYVQRKGIPYAILLGPEEVSRGLVKLKVMATGVEQLLTLSEVKRMLQED